MIDARRERRALAIVLCATVVALVAAEAPLIGYGAYTNVDEAYAAALGERVNEGFVLYRGAISQRGPLLYYAFAAIGKLSSWDNVHAVRVAALAFGLAHLGCVAWAARTIVSRRAAIVATALAGWALVVGLPSLDSMALHAESFQVPLVVGAAGLGVIATRAKVKNARLAALVGAGLSCGAAIGFKHSILVQPLPIAVWLVAEARRARRSPVRELATFAASIVVIPAILVAHAAASGSLGDLVYWCITFNLGVHMRPPEPGMMLGTIANSTVFATSFLVATLAILAGTAMFVFRRARAAIRERAFAPLLRGFDGTAYLGLHFLVALASAASMLRFFVHYFLPAVAFLVLATAAWTSRRLRTSRGSAAAPLAYLVTCGVVLIGGALSYIHEKLDGRVMHDGQVQRVSRYITATTSENDRVFVWGFSPWIYEYAHRRPAGRFVFETYVTGIVPWFYSAPEADRTRIAPGATEALLGDLEREKPEVVVDAGSVMLARPMRAYAPFAAWLRQNYCFEVRLAAYDVYRRKNGACANDSFPAVHPPVNWWGARMGVPMPLPVDDAESRPLCAQTDEAPVWFDDAPRPPKVALLQKEGHDPDVARARLRGAAEPEELAPALVCRAR